MAIARTKRQQKQALKRVISRLVTSAVLGLLIVGCFLGYDYLTKAEALSISKARAKAFVTRALRESYSWDHPAGELRAINQLPPAFFTAEEASKELRAAR